MPSSCWQPSKAAPGNDKVPVVFDLGSDQQVKKVYIFLRDAQRTEFYLYGSKEPHPADWRSLTTYDNNPANNVHFCNWDSTSVQNASVRYLKFVFNATVSDGKIGEILVISAANDKVRVVGVKAADDLEEDPVRLVDEQDYVVLPITQEDGAYFDEMYYVRTAEEHLKLEEPYEWTHPPLGKLIIAAGIRMFGMNPFGWRIPGVLAAALMIPILFIMAKRIFKSALVGIFAAVLLTVDFMHFALARLATGEIYIAFFSLLIFYFAFDYLARRNDDDNGGSTSLFLSIVFFGLCFTVKWIAIFGLVAILTLFVVSNIRDRKPILSDWLTVLAGLFVSAAIYIATYIPYMFSGDGHGLLDVIKLQFYMFGYHAGLQATHLFSSAWWSWPLMLNPLWMYFNSLNGTISTIVLMGNPVVWWCSIPVLIFIAARLVAAKLKNTGGDNSVALSILIPFLLLWLPFALITRILFIYHFMPSVPFMILALSYCVNVLRLRATTRRSRSRSRAIFVIFSFLIIIAAVVLFCLFYPVISGYPVTSGYKDDLKWLSNWSF